MKFHINRDELLRCLQYAQEISENRGLNSYYSYFLFDLADNRLIIKSADRQTTFEQTIIKDDNNSLAVAETGSCLLPGNKIHNVVSTFPEGIINFEKKENNIILYPGSDKKKIKFSVRIRNVEDYPSVHKGMPEKSFSINKHDFLKIIRSTAFAASSDYKEASLFLTGIFLEVKDSFLIAVATDRNRISISKMHVDNTVEIKHDDENDVIIPSKAISFLKRVIQQQNAELILAVEEDKIFFSLGNILITSNLISGKYYNYSRIIPEPNRNIITVKTEDLKNALDRVTTIADHQREVLVDLTVEENSLIISSEEKEKGSGEERLDIEMKGNAKTVHIKSQFIVDPLKVIETEYVHIDYGNEPRDLVKIVSVPEEETMHIAAPINI